MKNKRSPSVGAINRERYCRSLPAKDSRRNAAVPARDTLD
jgi:hypothetical protein